MNWVALAAASGAAAVIAGAFGAHGLAARLSPEQLGNWKTAAEYQLLHSAVLLALALFGSTSERSIGLPASLFALGMALFSGSIYLLTLTPWRWLWPATPLGGLCLIAGWVALIGLAWQRD